MSEFPEWVEREIGWNVWYDDAQDLHRQIRQGKYPDPRGTGKRLWWREWWPFDRRKQTRLGRADGS